MKLGHTYAAFGLRLRSVGLHDVLKGLVLFSYLNNNHKVKGNALWRNLHYYVMM